MSNLQKALQTMDRYGNAALFGISLAPLVAFMILIATNS